MASLLRIARTFSHERDTVLGICTEETLDEPCKLEERLNYTTFSHDNQLQTREKVTRVY